MTNICFVSTKVIYIKSFTSEASKLNMPRHYMHEHHKNFIVEVEEAKSSNKHRNIEGRDYEKGPGHGQLGIQDFFFNVLVNLNERKYEDISFFSNWLSKCEPSDLKAITAAITPGFAIDFFPLFLSLSCSLSLILSLFPTHWQLVCRSEAAGVPTTWRAELRSHKQTTKVRLIRTDKDAHSKFHNVRG